MVGENMNMPFFFVHHGQTDWNDKGLLMGQQDPPLNELGRLQAHVVAKRLQSLSFATLCYSTATRAKETALIIAENCPCSIHSNDKLKERSWGVLEGEPVNSEQLIAAENHLPFEAETKEQFRQRVIIGMEQAFLFPGPLVIVSHWGVYEVICEQLNLKSIPFLNTEIVHYFQEFSRWRLEIFT